MKGRVLPLLAATAVAGFGHAAIAADVFYEELVEAGAVWPFGFVSEDHNGQIWFGPYFKA